jgi:glutamate-1-semialdehyde aminotransferase
MICALGAVPLGYAHEGVTGAILRQLGNGLISASLPTTLEEEIAARLVQIIPCARDQGQVRFVKTGSEACAAAARIARRATGRDHMIVVGYHGWHDWVMETADPSPGIPKAGFTHRVDYNDLGWLNYMLDSWSVAAVMLEPTLLTPPAEGYLQAVVDLCHQHGALSIFDEMVCGFRWARAGGQEYFGVTPDMAVYGKGLANGMPLACIVGPERIMRNADVISGTFGGEALSLAAAGAVLDAYEQTDPIESQWAGGGYFLNYCMEIGIPTTGYAVHPKITYKGAEMALFLQETAWRGLLLHPSGFNVSAALTPADLEIVYVALKGAKAVLDSGKGVLEGVAPPASIFRRNT